MVEHRTFNPAVVGSSPTRPIMKREKVKYKLCEEVYTQIVEQENVVEAECPPFRSFGPLSAKFRKEPVTFQVAVTEGQDTYVFKVTIE